VSGSFVASGNGSLDSRAEAALGRLSGRSLRDSREDVVTKPEPNDFECSYQGQLFEALDAPDPEPFRAFVVTIERDPVRNAELWGSFPVAPRTPVQEPYPRLTINGRTYRPRGGYVRFVSAPCWQPGDALRQLCWAFAARLPNGELRPLGEDPARRWSGGHMADARGRLRAYLRSVPPSLLVFSSRTSQPKPHKMRLRRGALPAQVLVTLYEQGPLESARLFELCPGSAARIANLLTPRGDLRRQDLIDVNGMLTRVGRDEAEAQKDAGTNALGAN
jgi:hypothetical protein